MDSGLPNVRASMASKRELINNGIIIPKKLSIPHYAESTSEVEGSSSDQSNAETYLSFECTAENSINSVEGLPNQPMSNQHASTNGPQPVNNQQTDVNGGKPDDPVAERP